MLDNATLGDAKVLHRRTDFPSYIGEPVGVALETKICQCSRRSDRLGQEVLVTLFAKTEEYLEGCHLARMESRTGSRTKGMGESN